MITKTPSWLLVSDLDDTVKVAETTRRLRTLMRGLFTSVAYSGMSELYQELGRAGADLHIVSSSPIWIRRKITRFLNRHKFPERSLNLRNWIRERDIKHYKLNKIESILNAQPDLPVILIGDDVERDPEVFGVLLKKYGERIIKIYIRQVRARFLEPGLSPFNTAFDIAYEEYLAQRLKLTQVIRIGKAVLQESRSVRFLPSFVFKPKRLMMDLHPELSQLQTLIEQKLKKAGSKK